MPQITPIHQSDINSSGEAYDACSFCEEVVGAESISLPLVREFFATFGKNTRVLLETEKFFVVPSLGALLPGHILVLPKSHYYSIGEIPDSDLSEFECLVQNIRLALSNVYGFCSAFEHGCVEGAGKAGACIDHAHLHLLPLSKNLQHQIDIRFGCGADIHSFSELREIVERRVPYLYYEAPDGEARAYKAFHAPSQFFRQLVFATDREAGNWDWKQDLRTAVVRETYDTLRDAFTELEKQIYARDA
jgi:diadenosine tetraphosphate (Ap4A) HIT family hydrolase